MTSKRKQTNKTATSITRNLNFTIDSSKGTQSFILTFDVVNSSGSKGKKCSKCNCTETYIVKNSNNREDWRTSIKTGKCLCKKCYCKEYYRNKKTCCKPTILT